MRFHYSFTSPFSPEEIADRISTHINPSLKEKWKELFKKPYQPPMGFNYVGSIENGQMELDVPKMRTLIAATTIKGTVKPHGEGSIIDIDLIHTMYSAYACFAVFMLGLAAFLYLNAYGFVPHAYLRMGEGIFWFSLIIPIQVFLEIRRDRSMVEKFFRSIAEESVSSVTLQLP